MRLGTPLRVRRLMWSFAWPWALLALPLPWLVHRLLPEALGLSEAGLRVPNLSNFETLQDRSDAEQLLNWRVWVAVLPGSCWCCRRAGPSASAMSSMCRSRAVT